MWHVLHAAPKREPHVCKFLAIQGLRSYAPTFQRSGHTRPGSVRDGRHRWIFPGYVFFQAPEEYSRWDTLRWAPGVRQLLHQDGRPAEIDDAVIEHLQLRLATARPPHPGAGYCTGQSVIVEHGPLAMVDALFDQCLKTSDRVRILVHLLGRLVPVEVDATVLRPAG